MNVKQSGVVTATYTYGNELVGQGTNCNLYDGQGSSRQTSGSTGSVTATQVYDGFGETVASSGSTPTYGYSATSGYRDDGDAGLTHVGARYYDASVGRFITRDTYLAQKAYTYCEGDPINYIDPSGHLSALEKGLAGFGAMTAGSALALGAMAADATIASAVTGGWVVSAGVMTGFGVGVALGIGIGVLGVALGAVLIGVAVYQYIHS